MRGKPTKLTSTNGPDILSMGEAFCPLPSYWDVLPVLRSNGVFHPYILAGYNKSPKWVK